MARPSIADERRLRILGALVKYGEARLDGASVADIERAARLTPGLVHYRFKQAGILLAALRVWSRAALPAARGPLGTSDGDAIAELTAFIDFHLGLGADADPEALACWILLSGEALRAARVRVEFEEALRVRMARLADVIRRGVGQRLFKCDRPDEAASALVALIQGYFVLAATARNTIPRGSAAASAKRMAEGLLRPSRALTSKKARS